LPEAAAPAAVTDRPGPPPDRRQPDLAKSDLAKSDLAKSDLAKGKRVFPERVFYGRRKGHRLRDRRRALLEAYLPRIGITLPAPGTEFDPKSVFSKRPSEVWLEIGFGSGEHLVHQARAHPNTGFIGCEPYVNGVASLVRAIDDQGLSNIRIYPDDVRDLFDRLAAASIARVYLLFPDPWPKTRHHKRRLVNAANLDFLAHLMEDGAEFWFATDHDGYCRWTLAHLLRHPEFDWLAERPRDWRRPSGTPATRYEMKSARAGHGSTYLRFRRRPRGTSAGPQGLPRAETGPKNP
jgi:tRNA (guanine-N7-)-methyltransferase